MDRNYLRVAFRINLHHDDIEVLYRIKTQLGVGSVEIHRSSSVYILRNVNSLLNILVPTLEANKLRSTKYLDYLNFKEVLLFISSKTEASSVTLSDSEKVFVLSIIRNMNKNRTDFSKYTMAGDQELNIKSYKF